MSEKSINIHVLSASKEIRPYSLELKSVAESAVLSVEKILPIRNIDIVLYDNARATIDEIGGVGGFTPNANTIFISLNPRHPRFKESLSDELTFTIAHELHHTIRWQKEVEGDTLLEALVFEGLADHFAQEITGRKFPSPWSQALTTEQKSVFLEKASKEWDRPTYDNAMWFFGATPEVIPRWTGYTIGYDLVAEYLKSHPGTTAASLVSADASLFSATIL
ncbi:MAG: DUF2268 domain-containing putative Zn-dependent protease [Patescibacteria group bacterium]